MGIRFLCPNGHKLNVKAFLAGKRGICPRCDAKFLVPKESGGLAETIDEVVAVDSGEYPQHSDGGPPPAPNLPPTSPGETLATEELWYVRMASGEQFGPASQEVMCGWVAEGRVTVDCWVWRTDWPEWLPGGQAITLMNGPAAPTPPVPPALPGTRTTEPEPSPAPVELPVAEATEDLPAATSPTSQYLNSKRKRQDRARKATFYLGGLVLLLLAVLVAVLMKNSH